MELMGWCKLAVSREREGDRSTAPECATVLELFRACRSRRGAKGRNDRIFLETLHDFAVHNITWRALPPRDLRRKRRGMSPKRFNLEAAVLLLGFWATVMRFGSG
jgi:hypothetical protein